MDRFNRKISKNKKKKKENGSPKKLYARIFFQKKNNDYDMVFVSVNKNNTFFYDLGRSNHALEP